MKKILIGRKKRRRMKKKRCFFYIERKFNFLPAVLYPAKLLAKSVSGTTLIMYLYLEMSCTRSTGSYSWLYMYSNRTKLIQVGSNLPGFKQAYIQILLGYCKKKFFFRSKSRIVNKRWTIGSTKQGTT